jgi:predicted RND superfamily exporter protein
MTSDENPQSPPSRWTTSYVAFLSRRAVAVTVAATVLFALSLVAARRLQLRSDFSELLPQDDPELTALHRLSDRVGAPSNLIVAVEGPDPAANERFAEAFVARLRPHLGGSIRVIDYRADAGRPFFEHNKALYADLRDLRRIDDDLEKVIASGKNPAFVPFADEELGEEKDNPRADLRALKRAIEKRQGTNRFSSGYYESEDRSLLAIVIWTASSGTGDESGFAIRARMQRLIDETRPASFGNVTAQITGDIPSAIEEHDALKSDIEWVSIVCTVLVITVIVLYYGSPFSLPYIFFPTLLGVAAAFGLTALTIGYLNTNTAFLGSIILGNGINFGIILLARYREERLREGEGARPTEQALAIAITRTARPTLAAALCAGIAYGSLALTRFRGFRQFGEIGGAGMVLCWIATFSVGPALICLTERVRGRPTLPRAPSFERLTRGARWLLGQRRVVAVVLVVLTAVALVRLIPLARSPFEYDFSKLRNQRSRKHGAGELYGRVGRIFPRDLAPVGVALLPSAADAPAYRTALLEKDCMDAIARGLSPGPADHPADPNARAAECARRVAVGEPTGGLLSTVATAYDFLPKDQAAKLPVIADIRRRLADPALESLSPDERKDVDALSPPADLRPLAVSDLPDAVAWRFRERDGTVGRIAMIFPVRVWANWDGHNLIRLSGVIKNVRLPDGAVVDAAGHASLFAAMLSSIAVDGPIATVAAFLGVVLMVVLLLRRPRSIALVLLSLVVGVIWMGGAGAALGLKLNFLNFVVLPITLGIGVDYAVNVFARLEGERPETVPHALAETGSAVALCSSTTVIGYSSLLIASNGALRSFGKLADLGEISCLVSALLLVPMVAWTGGRRGRQNRPSVDAVSNVQQVSGGSGVRPDREKR